MIATAEFVYRDDRLPTYMNHARVESDFKITLWGIPEQEWGTTITAFVARCKEFADDYVAHPGKPGCSESTPVSGERLFRLRNSEDTWENLMDEEKESWNEAAKKEDEFWDRMTSSYNGTSENIFTYRGQRCEVYRGHDLVWRAYFEKIAISGGTESSAASYRPDSKLSEGERI